MIRRRSAWVASGVLGLRGRIPSPWIAVGLFLALVQLFWVSLQSDRIDQLHRERARLLERRDYESQLYLQRYSQWYRAISREHIVPRAVAELGMVEGRPGLREVVALSPTAGPSMTDDLLRHLAAGLDRFSEIRGALAREEEQ